MTRKDVLDDFKEIVEDYREEMLYDYYEKFRNTLELLENQQKDINKLVSYISIKEDMDFKDVCTKFEIGD